MDKTFEIDLYQWQRQLWLPIHLKRNYILFYTFYVVINLNIAFIKVEGVEWFRLLISPISQYFILKQQFNYLIKVRSLSQWIKENGLRYASGPIQNQTIHWINIITRKQSYHYLIQFVRLFVEYHHDRFTKLFFHSFLF